jgi:hypothetical protein
MQHSSPRGWLASEGAMVALMTGILLFATALLIAGSLLIARAESQGSLSRWRTSTVQTVANANAHSSFR